MRASPRKPTAFSAGVFATSAASRCFPSSIVASLLAATACDQKTFPSWSAGSLKAPVSWP